MVPVQQSRNDSTPSSHSCARWCSSDGLPPAKVLALGNGGGNGRCRKVWRSSLCSENIPGKGDSSSDMSRDRNSKQEHIQPRKQASATGDKWDAKMKISLAPLDEKKSGDSGARKEGTVGQIQGP